MPWTCYRGHLGHPGVRVRNVRGNPDQKVYVYAVFSSQNGQRFGNPNPTTCLKSTAVHLQFYGSTAPICIAVLSWLLSFEERETLQYASHLYCSTPPFVRQYFWKNTGGWGHQNVSDRISRLFSETSFSRRAC